MTEKMDNLSLALTQVMDMQDKVKAGYILTDSEVECLASASKVLASIRDTYIVHAIGNLKMKQLDVAQLFNLSPGRISQIYGAHTHNQRMEAICKDKAARKVKATRR